MSASGLGRPSATTISKGCKFNKSTGRDIVGRELKEAVRLGLLEATPAEGRPTTYQAVIPACFQGVGREALNLPALSRDLPALEGVPAPREQARNSSEVETTNRKDLRAEVEEIEELTTPTNPSSMPGLDLISEESEATNLSGGESINTLKNEPPPFRRLRVIYGHKTVEVSYPDQDSDEFIGYLQSLGASCLVSTLPNGRIALHSTAAPIVELAA